MSLLCDCISRAEAIEALWYDISIESDEGLDAYKTVIKEMLCKIYDVQKENIEKLPSIKPQPKTGHWIDKKCSVCGCNSMLGLCIENYCANCGAKMVKSQESEDNAENDTEVWNGMGGRKVIAPKGTFEKIFNGQDTESDSI